MQESTWTAIFAARAAAGNALVLPFVLMHGTVLAIIAFGGDALSDSSVQLAVAGVAIIGSIWTTLNFDSVFADIAALGKDMSGDVAASNVGKNWAKAPIGVFRVMGVVFTTLIVIFELLAIY